MSESSMIRISAKFKNPRDAWLAFGRAAAAPRGAMWPATLVSALETGMPLTAAITAADITISACIQDGDHLTVPRRVCAGAWTGGLRFGAGRSAVVIDAAARKVMVEGPKDSAVLERALAVPELAEKWRSRCEHEQREERWADVMLLLQQQRASTGPRGAFRPNVKM